MVDETDSYAKKAIQSDLPLHKLVKLIDGLDENSVSKIRARILEMRMNVDLSSVKELGSKMNFAKIVGKNIENPVGGVSLPVGVAGPILIHGSVADGSVYLPLATTEGALVASTNRGASATTASGGITTSIIKDEMTRAPVFKVSSVGKALALRRWVAENLSLIKEAAAATTKHGQLQSADCYIVGTNVFVRLSFTTGEAMGMNMVTIASERVAQLIEENTDAKLVALSGNMCSDKKAAYINSILGRGKSVSAEALIDSKVLKEVLKVSSSDVVEVNIRKNMLGSSFAGSLSQNAHYANIIAASFIAMGQDAAQVVESSQGYTFVEDRNGKLYFSVTLPSLEVGVVGGGTSLAPQRELMGLTGVYRCQEGKRAKWLAEVIAAGVLCGELSLLCALASNQLASSHKKLGRAQ